MAEKRSQRFKVVLMLAERREKEVATRLGNYQQQIQAEQRQLVQLREYNQDYIQQIKGRRQSLNSRELISFRSFLQHLGEAEQEQVNKVERMLQVLERLQQEWRNKYQYRQSIEELIRRFSQEESAHLEKQLQKELDELAAQNHQRQVKQA